MSIPPPDWMPPEFLAERLHPILKKYDIKWRGHGHIYIDYQSHNIVTASIVLSELSCTLGVPVNLVRTRLIDLGWLNDDRNISSAQSQIPKILKKLHTPPSGNS